MTEVVVGENAVVDHYKVQRESVDAFHIAEHARPRRAQQQRSRRTRSRSAARSSATTSIAVLDGEGAECTLNGLYLADGERLVDNHTTIDHAKPHCASHELYKGILDGKARARLQRQDHRPAGRAEDRRQADQQGAAPVRRRDDQHQAAARDLRRRREVHARRGDRPARRRRDVLPARARPDASRGARHADSRVRRRGPRPRQDRAAARGARSGALRAAGDAISRRSTRHDARSPHEPRGLPALDVARVRADFPILRRQVHGKPLVYLDNAGTTQKPQAVIDATRRYYDRRQRQHPSRRAPAERARDRGLRGRAREGRARSSTPRDPREIVFTAERTEGINLVAHALRARRRRRRRRGAHHRDGAPLEHRAVAAALRGDGRAAARRADRRSRRADARRVRAAADGAHEDRRGRRTCRTRSARSIRSSEIVELAHARGVPVLVDGAQAASHMPVDVQALDCDFYVVLRPQALRPDRHRRALRQGGAARGDAAVSGRRRHDQLGDVREDDLERRCRTSSRPARRTSPASIGLGAAIDYLHGDRPRRDRARTSTSCSTYGTARAARDRRACASSARRRDKASVLSFVIDGVHPHDIGTILDQRRRRDPHRPSLRAAGDGSLRHSGDRARLARDVQHARRDRRARAALDECGRCSREGECVRVELGE